MVVAFPESAPIHFKLTFRPFSWNHMKQILWRNKKIITSRNLNISSPKCLAVWNSVLGNYRRWYYYYLGVFMTSAYLKVFCINYPCSAMYTHQILILSCKYDNSITDKDASFIYVGRSELFIVYLGYIFHLYTKMCWWSEAQKRASVNNILCCSFWNMLWQLI